MKQKAKDLLERMFLAYHSEDYDKLSELNKSIDEILIQHTRDPYYCNMDNCRQSLVLAARPGYMKIDKSVWYADAKKRYDSIKVD